MAVNVRSGDLDQLFLMPPSVKDWLPEDHLAFFVLDVVSELDLARLGAARRVRGRGELSQRQAGEILGVSHTWVRDMTKRYFGRDGQRIARTAEPEPEEWIPVIERLARGEISKRAARDELTVSDARINAMLAHIRGEAADPTIARRAMEDKLARPGSTDLYRKRQHSIEPVFGNIKANLGYRRFTRRGLTAVQSEWRLICAAHNMLKLRQTRPA